MLTSIWRLLFITWILFFSAAMVNAEEQRSASLQELSAALDRIGHVRRASLQGSDQIETLAKDVKTITQNPASSMPLLIERITNAKEDRAARLAFCELVLSLVRDKDVRVDATPLVAALEREDYEPLQAALIELLGKARDSRATVLIMRFANSPSESVRLSVVRSLGRIGDRQGIKTVTDLLQKDQSYLVRMHAAANLARIGAAPERVKLLQSSLLVESARPESETPKGRNHLLDKDVVQMAIVNALAETGSEEAVPILVSILQDVSYSPDVRKNAAHGLGTLRAAEGENALLETLKSGPSGLQIHAAEALVVISGNKHVDAISAARENATSQFVKMRLVQVIEQAERTER